MIPLTEAYVDPSLEDSPVVQRIRRGLGQAGAAADSERCSDSGGGSGRCVKLRAGGGYYLLEALVGV